LQKLELLERDSASGGSGGGSNSGVEGGGHAREGRAGD
jgi:hypothetical protein